MKIFGSWSELVSIIFRKDSQAVTLRPNQATTYTAARDVQLPAGDAAHELVGTAASQTLTNKTIDASSNTISNIDLAADVTGTLPLANGGTGQTTANAALNALLPSQAGNAERVLGTDGTNTSWKVAPAPALTDGDIFVGNSSNVANAVTMSGDVTLTNTGVASISSGVIVNADVNASAAIAGTKISPNFGTQNITVGSDTGLSIRITDINDSNNDRVELAHSDGNGGFIRLYDDSNNANVLIRSYGSTQFLGGNVGIGVAPATLLHLQATGGPALRLQNPSTSMGDGDSHGQIQFYSADPSDPPGVGVKASIQATSDNTFGQSGKLTFHTSSTSANDVERMSIDGTGQVQLGAPAGEAVSHRAISTKNGTSSLDGILHLVCTNSTSAADQVFLTCFLDTSTGAGGIKRDGSNFQPSFFASSDRRLKNNFHNFESVLSRLNQISLYRYNFKDGGTGYGPVAQELAELFPYKVTATDDGLGESLPSGAEPWTIGLNWQWELIKAIQELKTENDDLKARIEALEA